MVQMTVSQTIKTMGNFTSHDQLDVSNGFSDGAYANAYETEDYETASEKVQHKTAYYQIAHMLGFFASYELHEIPCPDIAYSVKIYRKAFKILFPEIVW